MISKEAKEWALAYDAIMSDPSIEAQNNYVAASKALRKTIVSPNFQKELPPPYKVSFNPAPKPSSSKKVRGKKSDE